MSRKLLVDQHNYAANTYTYELNPDPATRGSAKSLLHLYGAGGVTYTVQATGDDGTESSAAIWDDVTLSCIDLGTMAGAASWVDSTVTLDVSHLMNCRWRLTMVTSDGTNDVRAELTVGAGSAPFAVAAIPAGTATAANQASEITALGHLTDATQITNVRSALGTWTPATVAAAADSGSISAAPCKVGKVLFANSHATLTYYLMLFNLAAPPGNGTAPRIPPIVMGPHSTTEVDLGGATFSTGLSWASSTTVNTLTISATTSQQVSAEVL